VGYALTRLLKSHYGAALVLMRHNRKIWIKERKYLNQLYHPWNYPEVVDSDQSLVMMSLRVAMNACT
jgi:hypothetical protein